MIISLLVYGTLIGFLAALAALALEAVARSARIPSRFTWLGAIVLTLGLVIWAAASRAPASSVRLSAGHIELPLPTAVATASAGPFATALHAVRGGIDEAVNAGSALLVHWMPRHTEAFVLGMWFMASALLLVVLAAVQRRGRQRWESMPERRLHGVSVRVSDSTGPAVIGLAPPRIVVPGWLLARPDAEQRAALAHEQAHVIAGDPWLLAGACTAVAMMPWNPALWYMLARIRLAVEVDCDARVLRSGVAARSYGELLISVAEHAASHRIGALALSGGPSHLHKRIQAMTAPVKRFTQVRIVAACAVAGLAVLAACEAQLPTQADVANMDATSATTAAKKLAFVGSDSGRVRYWINDVIATEAAAKAVAADDVSSIQVMKDSSRRAADIRITTVGAKQAWRKELAETYAKRPTVMSDTVQPAGPPPLKFVNGAPDDFKGLIVIDGVKSNATLLAGLMVGKQIGGIRVLKGPAASLKYTDPAASYGAIEITTKK